LTAPGAVPERAGLLRLRGLLALLGLAFAAPAVAAQDAIFASGFELATPILRGGSNYVWHALGESCDREPFGVIPNYHEPGIRTRVIGQLHAMRAAGQDNLSLGLYHLRAPEEADAVGRITGTLLDSSGGDLHPRMRQNLVEFLADIRAVGFFSVVFRYHPQGANNPRDWDTLGPAQLDLLEENWSLIDRIEPLLQQSGLNWGTDLLVEGMPRARIIELPGVDLIESGTPAREGWSRYAREIWKRYSTKYGISRTVGFSFVSDTDDTRIDARAEHIDYVYTVDGVRRLPLLFALDIYGTPSRDEGWIFRAYHRHLRDEGLGSMVWLIAEAYYDDAAAARSLAEAMAATGQPVYYLTQWPLQRGSSCDPNVTVAPPLDFGNYSRLGF
jgi:hypothetical protein